MASKFRREVGRERYDISSLYSTCFVRNKNMRSTSFEMRLLDISREGGRIVAESSSFIDFAKGDVLMLTLDVNGKIFNRPIHASYRIMNVTKTENKETFYGLLLIEVDAYHRESYNAGLQNFTKATA